jgi:hypothetical protein
MSDPTLESTRTRWLTDRTIGITGIIIGVVSILVSIALGYYFYRSSLESRQLKYAIDPVRTAIVNSSQSSDLSVLYRGNIVRGGNLSSIRVYMWNEGKKPIIAASQDILRPIQLRFSEDIEILDARVLSVSRPEANLKVAINDAAKNLLDVWFSILENNDGASIQLIFVGSPTANLVVDGSIVGQSEVQEEKLYQNDKDAPLLYQAKNFRILDFMPLILPIMFIALVELFIKRWDIAGRKLRFIKIGGGLIIMAVISAMILYAQQEKQYSPYLDIPKNIIRSSGAE